MKLGIVYHEDFKNYDFGPNHPIRGYYFDGNIAFGLVKGNDKLEEKAEIEFIKPLPASDEEVLTVHTKEYIDFIKGLNEKGGFITLDTPVRKGMYDVAKMSAGAYIEAGRQVMDRTIDKGLVFGPMGHHAGPNFGGGFCIVNDAAIMIEYLRRNYGLKKIMTFDYAVNAAHGTISIFYETPEVLCLDIHQDPFSIYPGTGFAEQVGRGDGEGYTVNIPLPPFTSDKDIRLALDEIVVPIVREYRPEIIILVGLNGGHFTVNINQFVQTLNGLWEIVNIFSKLSDEICQGRFINMGGFSFDFKLLPLGFLATVAGILDVEVELSEPYEMPENIPDVTKEVEEAIQGVKDVQKNYWTCF